jgi:hypothetical protein
MTLCKNQASSYITFVCRCATDFYLMASLRTVFTKPGVRPYQFEAPLNW